MSGVDQPIVIAQSGYHVGHQRSWRPAEEEGFVKEEGLERYAYEPGGLIPAEFEADALGLQMWERGVDIVTAVNVWSAIIQRARRGAARVSPGESARRLVRNRPPQSSVHVRSGDAPAPGHLQRR